MAQSGFPNTRHDTFDLNPGRTSPRPHLSPSGVPDTSLTLGLPSLSAFQCLPALSAPEGVPACSAPQDLPAFSVPESVPKARLSPRESKLSCGQIELEGSRRGAHQPHNGWGVFQGAAGNTSGRERDAPRGMQQELPGSSTFSSGCFSPQRDSASVPAKAMAKESVPARAPPTNPHLRSGCKRALDLGTSGELEAPLAATTLFPEDLLLLAASCGIGPRDVELAHQLLQQQILLQHRQQQERRQSQQQQQLEQQQQKQLEQQLELQMKAPRLIPNESLVSTQQEHTAGRANLYHEGTSRLQDTRLMGKQGQPLTAPNDSQAVTVAAQGFLRQQPREQQDLQGPRPSASTATPSTALTSGSSSFAAGSSSQKLVPFMPRLVLPGARARDDRRTTRRTVGLATGRPDAARAGPKPNRAPAGTGAASAPVTSPPAIGHGSGQATGTPVIGTPGISTPGTGGSGITALGTVMPASCTPVSGTPAATTPGTGTPAAGAPGAPGSGAPPQTLVHRWTASKAPAAEAPEPRASATEAPGRRVLRPLLDLNKSPVEASAWSQRLMARPPPGNKFSSPPEESPYGARGTRTLSAVPADTVLSAEGELQRRTLARERGAESAPLQRRGGESSSHTASASTGDGHTQAMPLTHLGLGHTTGGTPLAHMRQGQAAGALEMPLQLALKMPEDLTLPGGGSEDQGHVGSGHLGGLASGDFGSLGSGDLGGLGSGDLGILGRPAAEDMLLYRCHVCGKSFAKSQSLGGHMNTHKRYNTSTKAAKTRLNPGACGPSKPLERPLAPWPPPVTSAPPAALLVRPLPASMRGEGRGGVGAPVLVPTFGASSPGSIEEDAPDDGNADAEHDPERHLCTYSRHGQGLSAQIGAARTRGFGMVSAANMGTPLAHLAQERKGEQQGDQKGDKSSKSCISALLWPHSVSSNSDLTAPSHFHVPNGLKGNPSGVFRSGNLTRTGAAYPPGKTLALAQGWGAAGVPSESRALEPPREHPSHFSSPSEKLQLHRLKSLGKAGLQTPSAPEAPCARPGVPRPAQGVGLGRNYPGWGLPPSEGIMIMARLTSQQYKYWKDHLEPQLIQLGGRAASFL